MVGGYMGMRQQVVVVMVMAVDRCGGGFGRWDVFGLMQECGWWVREGRASERARREAWKPASKASKQAKQAREVERAVASSLGPGDAGVGVHGHGHGWVDLTARKRAGRALADDTYRSGLAGCVCCGQGKARQGKAKRQMGRGALLEASSVAGASTCRSAVMR